MKICLNFNRKSMKINWNINDKHRKYACSFHRKSMIDIAKTEKNQVSPSETKWVQVSSSETPPLPPILLSNFSGLCRALCRALFTGHLLGCILCCRPYMMYMYMHMPGICPGENWILCLQTPYFLGSHIMAFWDRRSHRAGLQQIHEKLFEL